VNLVTLEFANETSSLSAQKKSIIQSLECWNYIARDCVLWIEDINQP